jgi:hypothetical protein
MISRGLQRKKAYKNPLPNSIGQLGGFAGNYTIGLLKVRTHSLVASFAFIAFVYVGARGLMVSLRIRNPLSAAPRSKQLKYQSFVSFRLCLPEGALGGVHG